MNVPHGRVEDDKFARHFIPTSFQVNTFSNDMLEYLKMHHTAPEQGMSDEKSLLKMKSGKYHNSYIYQQCTITLAAVFAKVRWLPFPTKAYLARQG